MSISQLPFFLLKLNDFVLQERSYLLFGACVQSHPEVKEKVLARGWADTLAERLREETSVPALKKLVYAVSCLVRGHTRSQQVRNLFQFS